MRFGRIGLTRPESFPKLFNVYTKEVDINGRGRVGRGDPILACSVRCILSVAKPDEQEMFHQMNVRVTHTLIQRGKPAAKEQDIFALCKGGTETRWFRVQAVQNKGEMDIDTVYYCEERGDLKK